MERWDNNLLTRPVLRADYHFKQSPSRVANQIIKKSGIELRWLIDAIPLQRKSDLDWNLFKLLSNKQT